MLRWFELLHDESGPSAMECATIVGVCSLAFVTLVMLYAQSL